LKVVRIPKQKKGRKIFLENSADFFILGIFQKNLPILKNQQNWLTFYIKGKNRNNTITKIKYTYIL